MGLESRRIYGLDILRAYSIFTVVYTHGLGLILGRVDYHVYLLPAVDGVTIFFALSGFLIGNIILRLVDAGRTSLADLFNFWRRRWLRTLPNYALILLLLVAATAAADGNFPAGALAYFVFVQNFATPHPTFFSEAWSLSVEEWFYLLFPFCLFGAARFARPKTAITVSLTAFILIPALLRLWRVETTLDPDIPTWVLQVKMQVITRLDSILYGVLTALIVKRAPVVSAKWALPLLVSGIALLFFDKIQLEYLDNRFYIRHLTLLVTPIAASMLLPYLNTVRSGSGAAFRILTFTSKISYALYLVHFSVAYYLVVPAVSRTLHITPSSDGSFAQYGLYWLTAIGLASLVYRYYEQPILKLRDRWWPDEARLDGR